ncbi:MAG: hypothetical protein Q9172_001298 [Xanthocarpia lactea]
MTRPQLRSSPTRGDESLPLAKSQRGPIDTEQDLQSVVGVSISRTQTRLRSPTTPAAEKAAAFFDRPPFIEPNTAFSSGYDGSPPQTNPTSTPEAFDSLAFSGAAPLPSPWNSEPKLFEDYGIEPQPQIIQDTQRSTGTGPMGRLADLNLKRFLSTFTMPSLPKPPSIRDFSMPTLSTSVGNNVNSQLNTSPGRQKGVGDQHSPQLSFKRSISDQSLAIRRVSSLGSSLGDDTRWENVQKPINSRAKAIADSLQDSNIRLPSLPNVNLGSLRPDFLRGRAASDSTRLFHSNILYGSSPTTSYGTSPRHENGKLQANVRPQKVAADDLQSPKASSKPVHSHFTKALDSFTGDIVIMGGYRGSILRSAKPPYRQFWAPVKVGLNIRKVNLEVGLELEDELRMEETIVPSGMLSHIGPVDMGRRLLQRLRSCRNAQEGKLRVHDYGYDWRLSPYLLSQRLIRFLEQLPSNIETPEVGGRGVFVIAHSLGGLITRHAVNQRPELFAGVIYAGVPQHCINILGPLRNGDEVLLSSKVLTAQVNFAFRTSYLLLPDDGRCFIDKQTKEDYPVNFFDIADWRRYAFSPCIAPALPPFVPPERKGLINSVTDSLMALPLIGRRVPPGQSTTKMGPEGVKSLAMADVDPHLDAAQSSNPSNEPQSTLSLAEAEEYLARTLADTVCFRDELKFDAAHAQKNRYPPLSILYGTSVPTVYRARVASRAAIKCRDAYEDLAFASGDGVCLARAAMLPAGYEYTPGGKVRTERGHVGLLGDLEALGKCLASVIEGRNRGIGLGPLIRDQFNTNEDKSGST